MWDVRESWRTQAVTASGQKTWSTAAKWQRRWLSLVDTSTCSVLRSNFSRGGIHWSRYQRTTVLLIMHNEQNSMPGRMKCMRQSERRCSILGCVDTIKKIRGKKGWTTWASLNKLVRQWVHPQAVWWLARDPLYKVLYSRMRRAAYIFKHDILHRLHATIAVWSSAVTVMGHHCGHCILEKIENACKVVSYIRGLDRFRPFLFRAVRVQGYVLLWHYVICELVEMVSFSQILCWRFRPLRIGHFARLAGRH